MIASIPPSLASISVLICFEYIAPTGIAAARLGAGVWLSIPVWFISGRATVAPSFLPIMQGPQHHHCSVLPISSSPTRVPQFSVTMVEKCGWVTTSNSSMFRPKTMARKLYGKS